MSLAREKQTDLILMDVQMPGMDGLTAIKLLKQNSETAHMKVVAFQHAELVAAVSQALDSGPCLKAKLARGQGAGAPNIAAMNYKLLFGFHAVTVRLKTAPQSIVEIHVETSRRDQRMRQFVERAKEAGAKLVDSDDERLQKLCGTNKHQGVVARVQAVQVSHSLDDTLDAVEGPPLLLVLDGVTDPHNLGACLRVADGAGAHAVVAPKDHAAGINATVAKVASGAAETVPYFMVTNLARTLNELKERDIRVVGTSDDAQKSLYDIDLTGPVALVLGAEGSGMRQLTSRTCDELVRLPMKGAVESLNVSVASGVCLYEALRQRGG